MTDRWVDRKEVTERGREPRDGGARILIKTSSNQLTHRFRLEKQMKVKIAIPHGSLSNTNAVSDSSMSRAVGLKHCLDEIDNTIKPVPV